MNKVEVKWTDVLPHKIVKKINKTAEARSGDKIYKRRNRRNYRIVMQYSTWDKIQRGIIDKELLNEFTDGYAVWISPSEYFGSNYPKRSKNLNKNFILGKTGFVYYKSPDELQNFKPLKIWKEVYELSTKPIHGQQTWIGEVCFNVKNAKPRKISDICADQKAKRKFKEIIKMLKKWHVDFDVFTSIPNQCGLGNYDYDFANAKTMENVKIQMLFLMLTCEDENGQNFKKYLIDNYDCIKDSEDSKNFANNIKSDDYSDLYDTFFEELRNKCIELKLIDYKKLISINAWNPIIKRPICPLCSKPLSCADFFKEVKQQEGRAVFDNTQREVVLMHVNALRPGKLNHKEYNLAWGHNYCNAIQGDKDISKTIDDLEEIVKNYRLNIVKKN